MEYKSLTKYYYNPNVDYQSVYKERFDALDPIHFDFQINGSPTFFFMAPEVSKLVLAIQHKNGKYSHFESQ